jgi:hypothetical protein
LQAISSANGSGVRTVPKGVEHCPVADEEVHLLLIELTGTPTRKPPRRGRLYEMHSGPELSA